MHCVVHSELAARDLEAITERLKRLLAAFEESSPQQTETTLLARIVDRG
jgi:uncharacterized protein involved in exopolysaccharide biosynthesis